MRGLPCQHLPLSTLQYELPTTPFAALRILQNLRKHHACPAHSGECAGGATALARPDNNSVCGEEFCNIQMWRNIVYNRVKTCIVHCIVSKILDTSTLYIVHRIAGGCFLGAGAPCVSQSPQLHFGVPGALFRAFGATDRQSLMKC